MKLLFTKMYESFHQQTRWLYVLLFFLLAGQANAQISLLRDYENNESATIGTFQGISFRGSRVLWIVFNPKYKWKRILDPF